MLILFSTILSFFAWASGDSTPPSKPTVTTEKSALAELHDTLTYPALTIPRIHASVLAENDGVVTDIFAPLGQRVNKGDRLMAIRNTDPVYQYAPAIVRAPVSGIVSKVQVSVGNRVNRGDAILSVTDPSKTTIRIELSGADARTLKAGDIGRLTGPQIPAKDPVQGLRIRVLGVSPFLDPATGTATCELELVEKVPLAPGLVGRVEFNTNPRKGYLVSEQALYFKGSQPYLRLIEDGKVKLSQVAVGKSSGGKVEVVKGLEPGREIITRSSQHLTEGMEVSAQSASESKKL